MGFDGAGEPEVAYFDLSKVVDQNVLGFDVSVDVASGVKVDQPQG